MLDGAPFPLPPAYPPGPGVLCCGGGVARAEREKAGELSGVRGEERLAGMSQQRPARKLPSLLVDPAEETVRRRCRDPINVEGLLVSPPGVGGGERRAWGGGRSPGPRVAPGLLPRAPGFSHSLSHPLNQSHRRPLKPFALSFTCVPK